MNPPSYGIVVLNRYPELARAFLSSVRLHHKADQDILVVCDRHHEPLDARQRCLSGPFVYAKNANAGISYTTGDVILCNDDLTVTQDEFFPKLAEIAYKYADCGLMSPLIDGGVGNPYQSAARVGELWMDANLPEEIGIGGTKPDALPVCFPCVYIKRKLIDKIGLLDETFTGYGCDDNDYCIRARKAGFRTMITRQLSVKHGAGGAALIRGLNWSLSFIREVEKPSNLDLLIKKHSPEKVAV